MNINSKRSLPFVNPEEAGFSSERLGRIRPTMQKFIDQKKVPNIVTLIAREGKIVHFEAQGYLDFDSRKPTPKDAIFRLYSNSKPIAGVGIMILCEEGLLNLDDPVSRYIPAFKNPVVLSSNDDERTQPGPPPIIPTIPAKREITICDCLRNTSGLATPQRSPLLFMMEYQDIITELGWQLVDRFNMPPRSSYRERAEAHAKLPLTFHPGTEFEYHVGYEIIGAIVEKIVGKTLEEFYQERIFTPLGMKDTSFYLDEENLDRFTTCYQPKYENQEWCLNVLDRPETSEKIKGPKIYFSAGGEMGGLLSTAVDYARFAQMLLNGGELDSVHIMGRKSVEIMTANHTGNILLPMLGPGFGFGMGVGIYAGGSPQPIMRSVGTYGWGGAAGTTFFVDPKEKMLAVCFTQVLNHRMMSENTYQEDFERLVYQALQ